MPAEAVVTGVVRDTVATPLRSGSVILTGGNGDRVVAQFHADDKGSFRAPELPAGKWTVQVYGESGRTEVYKGEVTAKAGETKDLTIDVK